MLFLGYQKVSSGLCINLQDQQGLKGSKELDHTKDGDNVEEGKSEEKEINSKDDDHIEKEKDIELKHSASRDEPDVNDEEDEVKKEEDEVKRKMKRKKQ